VIRTFAGQIALALDGVRLAKEAESARVEADASRARAALFSSISHDLRTPLASITASVTSLIEGDASFDAGDSTELLETIRHEADRLNRLVGTFLQLSRMRSGGFVPAKSPAAVDELIEGVVGRLEPVLRGHRLRLLLREDLPEVPMDVTQIDQVLTNLLENAAKFSPPGSEIAVHAVRWQDVVQVRVADRGAGIPAEDRERVFEPFYRAEGDTGRGTGLGLAIARAIVEAHGGRIWTDGAPGGGTTVVFELPVRD
jgi:two-component system sensor histidine kinase KdpD